MQKCRPHVQCLPGYQATSCEPADLPAGLPICRPAGLPICRSADLPWACCNAAWGRAGLALAVSVTASFVNNLKNKQLQLKKMC